MGEDDEPESDSTSIRAKLRACEACKARKIRCDKLAPCSACRSANIPCRSARNTQEKRQRVIISNRYEEQLARINEQLSQLKESVESISRHGGQAAASSAAPPPGNVPTTASLPAADVTPNDFYLGESSFEMHSRQTSKALESVLQSSTASQLGAGVTSVLPSLRGLLGPAEATGASNFIHDMQMPSTQLALKALRLAENSRSSFFLCVPMIDFTKFKETCQKVYFPVDGYTISEFIITNGGLFTIFSDVSEAELRASDITPAQAAEAIAMCESNVSHAVEKLSPFLEPTCKNIESVLVAVQLAIAKSRPHIAWTLVSMSARLCLDAGLHRFKDNPADPDDNRKKLIFWYTYAMDKGLSLNFGRSPTFTDQDITVSYPVFEPEYSYMVVILWIDLAKVQGRIYDQLYSAHGQLASPEQKTSRVYSLVTELEAIREKCLSTLRDAPPELQPMLEDPVLDTEIFVLTHITLTYRMLPTSDPHPLRFSEECIQAARKALLAHENICSRYEGRTDNALRIYIDWNLLFSPFTSYIVIIGTAILDNSRADLELAGRVITSLESACQRSEGARRLRHICQILYRGAKSCMEQSLSSTSPQHARAATNDIASAPSSQLVEHFVNLPQEDVITSQYIGVDGWPTMTLDNTNDMSLLYDNYLAGNTGMMDFFEQELKFDGM